jgi:hypothetical protein
MNNEFRIMDYESVRLFALTLRASVVKKFLHLLKFKYVDPNFTTEARRG